MTGWLLFYFLCIAFLLFILEHFGRYCNNSTSCKDSLFSKMGSNSPEDQFQQSKESEWCDVPSNIDVNKTIWKRQSELGKGAFGTVFLLTCGDERAAMKIPIGIDSASTRGKLELKKEVVYLRQLTKMNSNNLIRLVGSGKLKDRHGEPYPYMITEIFDIPLFTRWHEMKHHDYAVAIDYGIQILRGIYELHSIGFIHRDLKPENIGITGDNRIILYDFGLSRMFTQSNGRLRIPRSYAGKKGTEQFMSCTAMQGREQGRVDDLWSWLYILMELLQKRLLWEEAELLGIGPKTFPKNPIYPARSAFVGCPNTFCAIQFHLATLQYEDVPDYLYLLKLIASSHSAGKTPKKIRTSSMKIYTDSKPT